MIGGAIALHILFGIPLLAGGVIIGVVSMLLLAVQTRRGPRHFEFVVTGLLVIITAGFVAGLFFGPVSWGEAAAGAPLSSRRTRSHSSCRPRSTRSVGPRTAMVLENVPLPSWLMALSICRIGRINSSVNTATSAAVSRIRIADCQNKYCWVSEVDACSFDSPVSTCSPVAADSAVAACHIGAIASTASRVVAGEGTVVDNSAASTRLSPVRNSCTYAAWVGSSSSVSRPASVDSKRSRLSRYTSSRPGSFSTWYSLALRSIGAIC